MSDELDKLCKEYVNTRGALRSLALAFCYKNGIKINTQDSSLERESLSTLVEADEKELFLELTTHPQIPVIAGLPKELTIQRAIKDGIVSQNLSPLAELCALHFEVACRALKRYKHYEARFKEEFRDFYEANKELFFI
jgi:hypothetical protein